MSLPVAGQLLPPDLYPVEPGPRSITLGDVDNDTRIDLIVVERDAVQVLLQLEDGTFGTPTLFPGTFAYSVDAGDFNDDGLTDIALSSSEGLVLLLQTDEGLLEATDPLPSDHIGLSLRVGDFNHDGRDDVASLPAGFSTDDLYIYLQGDGGLSPAVTYTASHTDVNDLKVGDLNGDGRDDLVVVSATSPDHDNISVLLQNSQGGFEDQVIYDAPGNRTYDCAAIGDINNDGLDDLCLCPVGPTVQIFTQTETGILEFLDSFSLGAEGFHDSMEIRDLDGDGLNEIIGVSLAKLIVLDSPAHPGGIQVRQIHDLGSEMPFFEPHHLDIRDINADGQLDVAVANSDKGVQVLINEMIFFDGFESGDVEAWTSSQN